MANGASHAIPVGPWFVLEEFGGVSWEWSRDDCEHAPVIYLILNQPIKVLRKL